MIPQDIFENCVLRAALAPSVHNTQPARWDRHTDGLSLSCDTDVGLPVGDPSGRDAALSCGAALEGMILALSAHNLAAGVTLTGHDTAYGQGRVVVAHLELAEGAPDGLHKQLENRFTWRGPFENAPANLFGWTRPDTRLVMDENNRHWLAESNDRASLQIMQRAAFRRELVGWMRLNDDHPRAGLDGMDRAAMRMSKGEARLAPFALVNFWKVLNRLGVTKGMISEVDVTLTAPVIAVFHRDINENSVVSGRSYLRMCLEAASLGFAGWPMAALSDLETANSEVCERFGLAQDRRLVQVIRFGVPMGDAPPRSLRPLGEIIR